MILRNLQLNESDRRELKTKIFASDCKNRRSSSLTLNKISTSHEECDEREVDEEILRRSPPSPPRKGGLNCDFLLGPSATQHPGSSSHDEIAMGQARIEELTIERCRLDLEGARVLGKALRANGSAISTLRSLRMVHLSFWDEDADDCEVLLPLLEGLAEAGKRGGCLESLELKGIVLPLALRAWFFSALGRCQNLRVLKLTDCDVRSENIPALAEALSALSSLESLDVSRNHIDGSSLEILLRRGLAGHESLRRLVLSHNPIGDDGAVHLSEFFSSSSNSSPTTRIKSLQLVDCDVWSPGCTVLARRLRDFDTLCELVVGGEWECHLQDVANSLKTNVVLKHLLVVCFEPLQQSSTMETIEYYLALNRAHRRISNDESLSFKLWPTILADEREPRRTNDNNQPKHGSKDFRADLWYHLLRRRPEVVAPH